MTKYTVSFEHETGLSANAVEKGLRAAYPDAENIEVEEIEESDD